jgi:hypothetical protein
MQIVIANDFIRVFFNVLVLNGLKTWNQMYVKN